MLKLLVFFKVNPNRSLNRMGKTNLSEYSCVVNNILLEDMLFKTLLLCLSFRLPLITGSS